MRKILINLIIMPFCIFPIIAKDMLDDKMMGDYVSSYAALDEGFHPHTFCFGQVGQDLWENINDVQYMRFSIFDVSSGSMEATLLYRQEGDRIYYMDTEEKKEYLLFDFSLQKGDFFNDPFDATRYQVVDIRDTVMAGNSYVLMEMQDTANPSRCDLWLKGLGQRGAVTATVQTTANVGGTPFRTCHMHVHCLSIGTMTVECLDRRLAGRYAVVIVTPGGIVLQGLLVGIGIGSVATAIHVAYDAAAYLQGITAIYVTGYIVAAIYIIYSTCRHQHTSRIVGWEFIATEGLGSKGFLIGVHIGHAAAAVQLQSVQLFELLQSEVLLLPA